MPYRLQSIWYSALKKAARQTGRLKSLVSPRRFERLTCGLEDRRSIQLS